MQKPACLSALRSLGASFTLRTAPSFREYCAMIIPMLRVVPSLRRQEDQDELVNVLEVEYGPRPGFIEPGYTTRAWWKLGRPTLKSKGYGHDGNQYPRTEPQ